MTKFDGLVDEKSIVAALVERGCSAECVKPVAKGIAHQFNQYLAYAARVQAENDWIKRRARRLEQKLSRLIRRGPIRQETRDEVWALTDGHCYYCDVPLQSAIAMPDWMCDPNLVMCVDHLVPRESGGPSNITNYVPACRPCNAAKSNKSYVEFTRDRHPRLRLVVSA